MTVRDVWTVFHEAFRSFDDVSVAAARDADPQEWRRAYHQALVNSHLHEAEHDRWRAIADELAAELYKKASKT